MKTGRSRLWVRLLVGLPLVLVLVIALGLLLLQTDAGLKLLASQLSRMLSSSTRTVQFAQIRIDWPAHVSIGQLVLSDSEGAWLTLQGVDVEIKVRPLLERHIEVSRFRMASMGISRLPVSGGKNESHATLQLPAFRVEEVVLERIELGAAVCGAPVAVARLSGQVQGGSGSSGPPLGFVADAERVVVGDVVVERLLADVKCVGGTLAAPEVAGKVTCEGLTSTVHDFTNFPPVNGGCQFGYSNAWLWVLAEAMTDTGNVVRIKAGVPAQVSFMTWKTRVDLDGLTVEADARFGHFPMGALNVSGGALSVSGKWGELSVAGTAGGIVGEKPFALDIGGGVKWDGSQLDVGLSRVTVEFAGVQAALSESLRFRAWNGSNEISAAWHMGVDDLAMASNVVPQGVKGRMQADLRVGGTLAMPELTGRVTCEGFVAPWYGLSTIAAVSGTCEAGLSNGLLNAALMVSFATGGVVTAKVHAPVELSLQPWRFHVDREQPLVAGMEASLNLSVLNRLDAFANSRVGGRLDLAVAHSGTLASGGVTGTCTLVEGEYENFLLGTIIRGAQVKFVVQDKVLRVEGGKATDGGSGQFTLAGNVSIDPAEGFPYAFELGGQKARLLRRPDVKATVTGRLGVEGTLSSIRANGKVHIDEALVELMNFRPAPPESVGAAPAESRVSARSVGDTNITLRLEVDIPGNLYVRGRTLDSAWAGNLVLGYTGGALGLSGYLEPRRGTLLLLKRPFKLSEGRIEFAEGWPPDPSLRLIATYSRPDLQAQVSIVGKMGNPEIVLSSEPALPEDEILARILFGKDMSTVTPLQAISLASEATKLRKLGGGTGVMGDVQEAVGIDRVEFREAGEGAAAPEVAAGKYLGDRSYVEMRRTTSSSQSGQTQLYLEHELRPNIVLEAESGIEMRSGVGIFWKMDY